MALQQFKVPVSANRRAQARKGAFEAIALEEISALLPPGHYSTITELGSGTCSLAAHFFIGKPPAHFRCLESNPELLKKIRPPAQAKSEQITVAPFDPALGISLPDSSQDLLLACHYLEYLRMDELYMTCHEARRIVKSGGLWALASLTLPENAVIGFWQRFKHPGQALDLIHYISPEDWHTRTNKTFKLGGLAGQIVILERT
jgi:hypothetical protein